MGPAFASSSGGRKAGKRNHLHQRGCFVRLLTWLGVLGCLCLLAVPAQADPTIATFSGAATDTNYTEYGNHTGYIVNDGPANAVNYYRLTTAGVGSTNNMIAFDSTQPGGPTTS